MLLSKVLRFAVCSFAALGSEVDKVADCSVAEDDSVAEAWTSLLQMTHHRERTGSEAEASRQAGGDAGTRIPLLKNTKASRCYGLSCMEEFIRKEDPAYSWKDTGIILNGTAHGVSWKGHVLTMISQRWLSDSVVSSPEWQHGMVVVVPDGATAAEGPLFTTIYAALGWYGAVAGPTVDELTSELPDVEVAAVIAAQTGHAVAVLYNVPPNLHFVDENKDRMEDDLMAWGQKRFFDSSGTDPTALLELPMAKAVVRAMDTVSAFFNDTSNATVKRHFAVVGTSKRAMLAWHVAAVDHRVDAIVPICRVLNGKAFSRRMMQCYGATPFVAAPYVASELVHSETDDMMTAMWSITDPVLFPSRFSNVKKFVFEASQDEYFMPDSSSLWWDHIPGPKRYRMLPNQNHVIGFGQVLTIASAIGTFLSDVASGSTTPELSWVLDAHKGTLSARLVSGTPVMPARARLWQAKTCSGSPRRDFRRVNRDSGADCEKCGRAEKMQGVGALCENLAVEWHGAPLEPSDAAGTAWEAPVSAPQDGSWAAFFIEVQVTTAQSESIGGEALSYPELHTLTTEVLVVPDKFPFPDIGDHVKHMNRTLVLSQS